MPFKLLAYIIFFLISVGLLGTPVYCREPIDPIPLQADYNLQEARIGKALFFDPILSLDRNIACVSCHKFNLGGADNRKVSLGVNNAPGNVQAPTVLNARYNFRQFWNGRASDLIEQAHGPVLNPLEMALTREEVERRINASNKYKQLFKEVYNKKTITFEMILESIVEFEKALITPNSKFDHYLRNKIQLDKDEAAGYQLFKELGCITCHNGINIGGNSFQKIGLINPYPFYSSYPDRFALTNKKYDKNVFKVPTLRNIALTAPYLHDASAKTLKDVIIVMSFHNLGYRISDDKIEKIIAFLKTLTGEPPAILMEN